MKSVTRLLILMPLVLAACGGTAASAARMGSAQAAIRSAREVGAEQNPTAALYLQYANEQYAQADRLSQRGDGEHAERVLQRAQADAELAMALARRTGARTTADQAVNQTRAFEAQTQPPTP